MVMESEDAKNDFLEKWESVEKEKLKEFFGEGGEEIKIDEAP